MDLLSIQKMITEHSDKLKIAGIALAVIISINAQKIKKNVPIMADILSGRTLKLTIMSIMFYYYTDNIQAAIVVPIVFFLVPYIISLLNIQEKYGECKKSRV